MQRDCCHVSFAFILKFLNFLQAFIAVSIILYSIWMLDQWNHHMPSPPHPRPHPHPLPPFRPTPIAQSHLLSHVHHQAAAATGPLDVVVSGFDDVSGFGFDWNSVKLPAQWFIYSFMGVGILYALLKTVLIVLEASLVAFIAIDRLWEKDLPFDPTGELDSLRSFIEENADICKWVGITVVVIQVLSLLLALILRAMVSSRRTNFDEEYNYENERVRIKEPLIYQQPSNAYSDSWSSWMREKYGLNNSAEKYTLA